MIPVYCIELTGEGSGSLWFRIITNRDQALKREGGIPFTLSAPEEASDDEITRLVDQAETRGNYVPDAASALRMLLDNYDVQQVIAPSQLETCEAALSADRAQQQQKGCAPPFAAPASQHDAAVKLLLTALTRCRFDDSISGRSKIANDAVEALAKLEQSAATRCRAEGGDGAPDAGDVSADRAQQGEPVNACEAFKQELDAHFPIPDSPHTSVIQRAMDNRTAFWFGWNAARRFTDRAATKASAPDCARCPKQTPYGPAVCYECANKAAAPAKKEEG